MSDPKALEQPKTNLLDENQTAEFKKILEKIKKKRADLKAGLLTDGMVGTLGMTSAELKDIQKDLEAINGKKMEKN